MSTCIWTKIVISEGLFQRKKTKPFSTCIDIIDHKFGIGNVGKQTGGSQPIAAASIHI